MVWYRYNLCLQHNSVCSANTRQDGDGATFYVYEHSSRNSRNYDNSEGPSAKLPRPWGHQTRRQWFVNRRCGVYSCYANHCRAQGYLHHRIATTNYHRWADSFRWRRYLEKRIFETDG